MSESVKKVIGRNEPCPCGSGRKYKRCHGVGAEPKLSTPAVAPAAGMQQEAAMNMMNGMDPQMMAQFSQALQRLPRGQMQRLQGIMQKAMSGKDVTQEAQEFEKTLPVELQEMARAFSMQMPAAAESTNAPAEPEMSEEEARALVAEAAAQGTISAEQASVLLEENQDATGLESAKKPGFWKNLVKK